MTVSNRLLTQCLARFRPEYQRMLMMRLEPGQVAGEGLIHSPNQYFKSLRWASRSVQLKALLVRPTRGFGYKHYRIRRGRAG